MRDVMQAFDELSLAAIRIRLRDTTSGVSKDNSASKASANCTSKKRNNKRAEIDRLKKSKDEDLVEKFGTIARYEVRPLSGELKIHPQYTAIKHITVYTRTYSVSMYS